MGKVELSGEVSIKSQGGGFINSKLEMGGAGMSLVFVILVSLGSIWRWGLTMLLCGFFYFCEWERASCGPIMLWD